MQKSGRKQEEDPRGTGRRRPGGGQGEARGRPGWGVEGGCVIYLFFDFFFGTMCGNRVEWNTCEFLGNFFLSLLSWVGGWGDGGGGVKGVR